MPVDTQHAAYKANISEWEMLRTVVSGEAEVKRKGESFLPRPSGRSDEDYAAYLTRAVFYDTASKTASGLLGGVFRKAPTTQLPAAIEYLNEDADGKGTPLSQVSKLACAELFKLGRVGVLVDFPKVEGQQTLADEKLNGAQARIYIYTAENIINWSYERVGSLYRLSRVVLREEVEEPNENDEFDSEKVVQFRVLSLDGDRYTVRIFEEGKAEPKETLTPALPSGEGMAFIPFLFMGAESNSDDVDKSPLYDIAKVNLAHYRNSADYEEALFMMGQPTPYITGLTEEFIKQHAGTFVIGSRAAWMLPEGTSVGLLESASDLGALREAMRHKEEQMVALGARLIGYTNAGVEAAETVRLRASGESNIMQSVADNLSRGMTQVLKWCSAWMKGPDDVEFALNDDFFAERLTGQDIAELIKAWQAGAITYETLFEQLVKGEIIQSGTDVEEYQAKLDEQAPQLTTPIDPADGDPEAELAGPGGEDDPTAGPANQGRQPDDEEDDAP